jgi:DNA-directed RNA polymerase subunit H (RpoH/RPB5)
MLLEMSDYLSGEHSYVLKKEILHSEEDVEISKILQIEQEFIRKLQAKNPRIGYNR